MRRALTLLSILFALSLSAQETLTLPKDNGKNTSFKESIEVGKKALEYFDSLCCRLRDIELVRACYTQHNQMVGFIGMNQMGHGITATVTVERCGRYVNYCFDNYKVDGTLLEEWLPTTSYPVAEQVKSAIFTNTVLVLAEVRNPGSANSMRR